MPEAKAKEEIKINTGNLASALRKIRNSSLKKSDYVDVLTQLQYSEPTSISPKKFDSILIKAIVDEFDGIDRDILLMAFGLLIGYERKTRIGRRRIDYLIHSDYISDFCQDNRGEYEKVDSDQQKKYRNSLIDAEKNRIDDLAEFLAKKMENEEFDEYIKDLHSHYDSNTDTPILPEPQYIQKQKTVPHQEKIEKDYDYRSAEHKQLFYMRLMTIALFSIAGILAFVFVIKPWWIENANAIEAAAPPIAPVENLLPVENVPVYDALLIEAESFKLKDIDEDKNIQIVPNIPQKLSIELEPQDANISTLLFESSNPDIVDAEYGYVTAYDNIAAGKSYVVDITITAKKTGYKDVIHVTVENPLIADDADGLVGDGKQAGY